ncbi:helix-turn-helix domain-containing protein [Nonomuraea typhae]|uniref:helix-turn-helix domain-containing protein n=1 Tax=Nonomuraea typhae TaxID=2603600 RepID=UPI0012F9A24F|nr:helix-turn-helix domain-containing protein [Nonomuraea typhae]
MSELVTALTALAGLPPVERARQIKPLIDLAKSVLAHERANAFREALAAGLSQAELARQLDISRSKVSDALRDYPVRLAE